MKNNKDSEETPFGDNELVLLPVVMVLQESYVCQGLIKFYCLSMCCFILCQLCLNYKLQLNYISTITQSIKNEVQKITLNSNKEKQTKLHFVLKSKCKDYVVGWNKGM